MPVNNKIQVRRGTYSEWDAQATGILASGEPGYITNFNKLKVGDGSTEWSDLTAVNDNITTIVINKTANTIPKMSVVYINGAQGDLPTIALSIASGEVTSSKTYGLTATDIAPDAIGLVVVDGALKKLNTLTQFSGVSLGTVLYLSPSVSGGITTTKPLSPNHLVSIGHLVRIHGQQGVIQVKIQNGYELGELHNVNTNGSGDNGKFLQYNSTSGIWLASSSGNFSSLSVNNTGVSLSGHNHNGVYADIATGDPQTSSNSIVDNSYALYDPANGWPGLWIGDSSVNASDPAVFDSFKSNMGLSNAVTGTGVANHIAYWNSSSGIVADSGQLYWDATNDRLGIGTTSPSSALQVNGLITSDSGLITSNLSLGSAPLGTRPRLYIQTPDTLNVNSCFRIENTSYQPIIDTRNDGNIAIGNISTPGLTHRLNVRGSTNDSTRAALSVSNSGASTLLHVRNDGNIGVGTTAPSAQLHVIGTGIFSNDLTVGGNLTVNGSVVTANVDRMEIEDPIITLGLASGNIVTTDTLDRGLALVRGTGLTAFMGWDSSATQFVMLSSGVASNSSGNYDAGTYGNLRINDLTCNTGNFNSMNVGGPARFTIGVGGFGFQVDRGNISPGFGGDILKLDVNDNDGAGYSTTLMSNAPGYDIIVKLPYDSGTLALVSDINTSQITGVLSVAKGGTNRSTYSNGQLLIGSGTSLVANTLTAGTGISITNGSGTITINSNIANPVTGTGVANHIAYWNSSSGIVADSGQLYWDSTNDRLGIGTTTPSGHLDVAGTILANTFTSTSANNINIGSGQIYLNGDTGNRIDFNDSGIGAPTFTTNRSPGTKIVLAPNTSSTQTEYALGIEAGAMWFSIPVAASRAFQWYAGTANIATLFGNGTLDIKGNTSRINVDSLRLDDNMLSITTTNSDLILYPNGNGSLVADPGGNLRGIYSNDFQRERTSVSGVAAGGYSVICGGSDNRTANSYSIVCGGQTNTASNAWSTVCGGDLNTASGNRSVVVGGGSNTSSSQSSSVGGGSNNQSTGTYSTVPGGFRGKATRHGELSHSAGMFNNTGDAQHTTLIARRLTTDATANVVLTLNGQAPTSTNIFNIPAQTMWTFSIKLSAYNLTNNEGAWWIFRGGIKRNNANSTILVGSLITESGAETSLSTATATVVADDTNEALEIRVTGVSGKSIRWVAVADISQVSYGTP